MKKINERTIQLEKDRQEIQLKLETLRNDTSLPIPVQSNQSLNRILAELRDQQRINEAALNMLSQRLGNPDGHPQQPYSLPVNTNRTNNNFNNNTNRTIQNIDHGYSQKISSLFGSYQDANLSNEEVRHMRLNYLQGGGSDQIILNKFTELENEARARNQNAGNIQYPQSNVGNQFQIQQQFPPQSQNILQQNQQLSPNQNQFQQYRAPPPPQIDPLTIELDKKIRRVDYDNRRLTAELADLQERYQTLHSAVSLNNFLDNNKPLSPNKTITPNKYAIDSQVKRRNDNSLPPINNNNNHSQRSPVQQNRNTPKQYASSQDQLVGRNQSQLQSRNSRVSQNSIDRQNPQNIPQNSYRPNNESTNSSRNQQKIRELSIQSYDATGGFVIFLDFITNIDPAYGCARVITCLHHPKSGLGEPSLLPVVNTETYIENNNKSSVALVSTKQPVPRCPPQQALTILVELQMAATNSNEVKLKSCGWTKLQLFDSKNRLLSGRWKLPLKRLPIQSDTHVDSLNTLPPFGISELHYRLVNLRDSDEQTNAPISPSFSNQYVLLSQ